MKNIITLKDTSGTDVEFKLLDQFTYDTVSYTHQMCIRDRDMSSFLKDASLTCNASRQRDNPL